MLMGNCPNEPDDFCRHRFVTARICMSPSLIAKYTIAGPRYTSYPTVPFWNTDTFCYHEWQQRLTTTFAETNPRQGVSLYIHLPYCDSLCTFCACHKHITRNHDVERSYIDALLTEWQLYIELIAQQHGPERPRIAELHLGGGTPSFFSPHELRRLLTGLFRYADPTDQPDYGWEGHPNNTTPEHLQTLYNFGFRRVSFGVQDYDPVVQQAIHRVQPFANVRRVTEQARAIGYTSICHDLIFGLPRQTPGSVRHTIGQTLALRPNRIAYYAYAHVPWLKGTGQRSFDESDLPSGIQKRLLYETGRDQLERAGYTEIGMDHFALAHDPLHQAMQAGTLHRNFMGYTTRQTTLLIGLGASAIGDTGAAFSQNIKEIATYLRIVQSGQLPLLRGHLLTAEDQFIRGQILNLMCRFRTSWKPTDWSEPTWDMLEPRLNELAADGLIDYDDTALWIRPAGRPFLRTICMAIDPSMHQPCSSARPVFSQTV
jgi:oxygen-independent coproporphyrinogen-3 oxidase